MKKILIIGIIVILIVAGIVLFNSHQDWREIFKVTYELKKAEYIEGDMIYGTLENLTNYKYKDVTVLVTFRYNSENRNIVLEDKLQSIKENEEVNWLVAVPTDEFANFDDYEINIRYKK